MTEIRVPTLGESVTEATIGRWFKKAGDVVRADEALAELETDKVTLEVNAPAAGVLAEIVAKEGETVQPGALLGQITPGGAATAAPAAPAPAAKPAPAPVAPAPAAAAPATAMPPSPAAAKIAADKGIDVSQVAGLRQARSAAEVRRHRLRRPSRRAGARPRAGRGAAPGSRARPRRPTTPRARSA